MDDTLDYKSFPDRWAAIAWICANQLHKHNMNEIQRAKLIQEEYEARNRGIGGSKGFRGNQYTNLVTGEILQLPESEGENNLPVTRIAIAQEHGIGQGAVKSAVEVGRGIDKAAEVDPDFKRDVLSGESPQVYIIHKKYNRIAQEAFLIFGKLWENLIELKMSFIFVCW